MPSPLRIALIVLLALLLLAGAAIVIVAGLVGSETGSRWLVSQTARWTGGVIEWQQMEGPLLGPLALSGVRITQPGLEVEVQSLSLDWRATALIEGRFQLDGLRAEGIRIALAPTPEPPPEPPFDPSALALPVDLSLRGIQLRGLQLVQPGQPAQAIDQIDLDAELVNGELSLQRLTVSVASGSVSLAGTTRLSNPMPLQLEAAWDWLIPAQDATGATAGDIPTTGKLALEGSLQWGEAIGFDLNYQVNGRGLEALAPELPTPLAASGSMRGEYRGEQLSVAELRLAMAETGLRLRGDITLPADAEPEFDISLEWSDAQWPLAVDDPQVASAAGELKLAGTTDAYTLALQAMLAGQDIPPGEWQGRGRGDLSRLELQQLRGSLMGGEIEINGPVSWDPVPRWTLELEGSDLDPAQLIPDTPGRLALSLKSTGQLDPDRGLEARITLEKLSGVLMDHALDMQARAHLAGEVLELHSLTLLSGGNRAQASGTLSPQQLALDWQLQAPSPGSLLPGASGDLAGSGILAGSPDAPRLQAQFHSTALQLDALQVSGLKTAVQAGLAADDKLQISLSTGQVQSSGEALLESVSLNARGISSEHSLALVVDTGTERVEIGFKGGLSEQFERWQGELIQLDALSEPYGEWQLVNPATLSLAADKATLGDTCLSQASGPARLCARADQSETGSKFDARLEALPIELFAPLITGEVAGEMNASLAADGTLQAKGGLDITPGLVKVKLEQGEKQLTHGGGRLKLDIGAQGLNGTLSFATPEQGHVDAGVELPALTALPLAEKQPMGGHIRATLPDLAGLAAWVPELASTAGRLDANLQLAGTLDQPEILGDMVLADGAADIPSAGLELRQIELAARSDPSRIGLLAISGGLQSGPGHMELTGEFDMAGGTLAMQLEGERLQVYDTGDARVLLSPDLAIGWSEQTLKARGQLFIPRADITPRLSLSPTATAEEAEPGMATGQAIAPSPDVVLINAGDRMDSTAQPTAPFRIDSEIELLLGEKVKINALGFISRVTGAVMFTNLPEKSELIPMAQGRLSTEEGTFRAFGQDLDIETGQLIFANVPATEPELNVRAVRWIDNDPKVTAAGVLVTGSVTQPVLELFSRPQLEPSEVQSYLLTGRSSNKRSDVLSIGTYLSPRVYVGYGYNRLEKTSEFNSLFTITPRYGLGADFGEADSNINVTFTHER